MTRRRLKCKIAVFTGSLGGKKSAVPANHRRTMGGDQSSTVKSALIPRRIFRVSSFSFFSPSLLSSPRPCVIDSDVDMAIGRGRIDVDEYVECERHRCVPLALSSLTPSSTPSPQKIKSSVLLLHTIRSFASISKPSRGVPPMPTTRKSYGTILFLYPYSFLPPFLHQPPTLLMSVSIPRSISVRNMSIEAWKNGKKTGFPEQGFATESRITLDATRYAFRTYNWNSGTYRNLRSPNA